MKQKIKEFLWLNLATLLMSIGIYFFKFPNNFCTGGVSGISVLLGAVTKQVSAGTFVLVINAALIVIGFAFLGKGFTFKTVYVSLLQSLLVFSAERLLPMAAPLTDQPLLELVFAILLPGIGAAILFDIDASSGGTDIVAMIIKKYAGLNISSALFCADVIIVILTAVLFGVETFLCSLLGFVAKVLLVDKVIERLHRSKFCTVIVAPEYEQQICRYITDVLHKSATVSHTYISAYRHNEKSVLLTALGSKGAAGLRHYVKSLDSTSFFIATNTSEISGKGFREKI